MDLTELDKKAAKISKRLQEFCEEIGGQVVAPHPLTPGELAIQQIHILRYGIGAILAEELEALRKELKSP